ncbi:MAG: hypothetical protein JNM18_08415, partial [Planctomycetaceae bacterium]|nr:hypothetical protein [Planctomycetaceae bacterium]
MKRIVVALMLASVLVSGARPVAAGDWGYPAGPYGYPQQQDHPVLRKVLVGAGLIGIGVLIGRATAPQPNYGHGHHAPIQPQFQPQFRVPVQPQHPYHHGAPNGH